MASVVMMASFRLTSKPAVRPSYSIHSTVRTVSQAYSSNRISFFYFGVQGLGDPIQSNLEACDQSDLGSHRL